MKKTEFKTNLPQESGACYVPASAPATEVQPDERKPILLPVPPDELPGQGYRKRQLADWLYKQGAREFGEMTNLPRSWRESLAAEWRVSEFAQVQAFPSADGSVKYLFTLHDGSRTEAVYLPYQDRKTICISSQVGCPAGCVFCATGRMGFGRNLTGPEIIDQILAVARHQNLGPREIRNVVLMGMGEPLLNYENVAWAVRRMLDENALAMSPRRVTLSTVGIPRGIRRMAADDLGVKLALSLHAPDDETRRRIIPTAHSYSVAEILEAVRAYFGRTKRRVTIEYTMLRGINDSEEQAGELARLLQGLVAHVNLIPFNPWEGAPVEGSGRKKIQRFAETLEKAGLPVTVRWSRGVDVGAACGQLALKEG